VAIYIHLSDFHNYIRLTGKVIVICIYYRFMHCKLETVSEPHRNIMKLFLS